MDMTQILDCLYVSDYLSVNEDKLKEEGITCVINCTKELENAAISSLPDLEYVKLNCKDYPDENIARHFDSCCEKIDEIRAKGGKVLAHCYVGVSRSVTICLAYLVKHESMSLREAYIIMRAKRPRVKPNYGFWRQLIEFERQVRGESSVKMVVFPGGCEPDVYKEKLPYSARRREQFSPVVWPSLK